MLYNCVLKGCTLGVMSRLTTGSDPFRVAYSNTSLITLSPLALSTRRLGLHASTVQPLRDRRVAPIAFHRPPLERELRHSAQNRAASSQARASHSMYASTCRSRSTKVNMVMQHQSVRFDHRDDMTGVREARVGVRMFSRAKRWAFFFFARVTQ